MFKFGFEVEKPEAEDIFTSTEKDQQEENEK